MAQVNTNSTAKSRPAVSSKPSRRRSHRSDWTAGLVGLFHRFGVRAFAWDTQEARQLRAVLRMDIDAVYCDRPDSLRRRAARTVLDHLHRCLTTWLAPVLCFTAEEAWEFVPAFSGSVHELKFVHCGRGLLPDEIEDWEWLSDWRGRVLPELEKRRQEKMIGKALEAKISLVVLEVQMALAERNREPLRELLNVSQLEITSGPDGTISVSKADGQKCERCWHWETDVGSNNEHPTICARCVKAVQEA
jgi:isoleucyl-tRNA synthetase